MSDYARHSDRPEPVPQPSPARMTRPAAAPHSSPDSEKLLQLKAGQTDSPGVARLEGLTALLNGPRGVRPTMQFAGTPVNDDKDLEREADTMGTKAMQMRADPSAEPAPPALAGAAVVQRMIGTDGDGKKVRQVSTNLIFTAFSNDDAYNLYTDTSNNAYATVAYDDEDYELAESSSGELEASAANEILLDQELVANEMKIETKDEPKVASGLDPTKIYTFTFTLDPTVKEAVEARETAVKTPRPKIDASQQDKAEKQELKVDESEADEPDYLSILSDVYREAGIVKENADYPIGKARKKKKGKKLAEDEAPEQPKTTLTSRYLGTEISIRLDKTDKGGVYPRVGRGDQKDKTTEKLAGLIGSYKSDEDREAFLAGVRGVKREAGSPAYQDGVEARATVLISDAIDYPGNSVVADRLLGKVVSEKDYVRLFTGSRKGEYSYGALPSQNRATTTEASSERLNPFKDVGTLMSAGTLTVNSLKSYVPTLRKLKSLVDADPTLVTITAIGADDVEVPVTPEAFSNYAAARAMAVRHQTRRGIASNQGQNIFSDAESDVEGETKRLSVLGPSDLNAKLRELLRQRAVLDRSIEALRALGADETGEMEVDNPVIVEEEVEEKQALKKKAATKRPRKTANADVDEQNVEVKKEGKKEGKKKVTRAPARKKLKISNEELSADETPVVNTKVPKKRVYKKRVKKQPNSADQL
jgi:hypothetical protein